MTWEKLRRLVSQLLMDSIVTSGKKRICVG